MKVRRFRSGAVVPTSLVAAAGLTVRGWGSGVPALVFADRGEDADVFCFPFRLSMACSRNSQVALARIPAGG